MQYLKSFRLASEAEETDFILDHPMTGMTCYADTLYPFRVFPNKGLRRLEFAPITVFYGGNGSGKSTLLNVIAAALGLERSAAFNRTPFFEEYLKFCKHELAFGQRPPRGSRMITSDDVFDYLLDRRAINDGIDRRREELFDEYYAARETPFRMSSLEDHAELKRLNEAKHGTRSAFARKRLPPSTVGRSNGESAFAYFTEQITEHALYLLDEPENSLSAKLQLELAEFLESSARFYHCQFVFSTHSPFLLSIKGARIYDLDAAPARERAWTELENVRIFHDFFETHRNEF